MRGYLVILVAAVGIACGQAATPTAPSSVEQSDQHRLLYQRSCATQLSARRARTQRAGWCGGVRSWLRHGDERLLPRLWLGRRVPLARLRHAVLRQARCRAIDGPIHPRHPPEQHCGVRGSRLRHRGGRGVPAQPAGDRSESHRSRRWEPGRMDCADRRREDPAGIHAADRRAHGIHRRRKLLQQHRRGDQRTG